MGKIMYYFDKDENAFACCEVTRIEGNRIYGKWGDCDNLPNNKKQFDEIEKDENEEYMELEKCTEIKLYSNPNILEGYVSLQDIYRSSKQGRMAKI